MVTSQAPLCACGQPSPGAVLCRACTADLAAKLTAVAGIAPDLEDAVGRQLTRGGGGKRTGDEQPLPFDARASDVAHALRNCLSGWVRVLAEAHPRTPWPADTLAGMAAWLRDRTDRIRQHEAAAELLRDVKRHLARAQRAVDIRAVRLYAGPCPGCGADLLGEEDASVIQCGCGRVNEVAACLAAMREAAEDRLGGVAWLVRAAAALGAPVNENTVYSWVHREQLVSRGGRLSESGRAVVAVYRLGDVLELAGRAAKVRG